MHQTMQYIQYDPNQYLSMPYTLISNTKKALSSKVVKQPFGYEVYCPISCKKVKIGVANSTDVQAMEFNTTSCRWVTVYVNHNIKYQVNRHYPNKKDKKIAKGNDWNIHLEVSDKGNIAILNPYFVDPENPITLYTFDKIGKVEKPIQFQYTPHLNYPCSKLQVGSRYIFLAKTQNGTFIGPNSFFQDSLQKVTIVNPNNKDQTLQMSPVVLKEQLTTSLDYWFEQLLLLLQAQKGGAIQGICYSYNLDQIYKHIDYYLHIDEQLRARMMHSQAVDFYHKYYPYMPRLYSAFTRFASFLNYNNTQYNCQKLAQTGFYNKSDMLQDLAYIQYPEIPIPNAEQPPLSSEKALRNRCFPFARMTRNLPFPNVPLTVSLNSMHHQTVSLKDIKHTDIFNNYIAFVSTDHQLSVWNTQKIIVEMFRINLLQSEAQTQHNIITTLTQIDKLSVQSDSKQDNFSALFDEQVPAIETTKPQEHKQVKADPTMLQQIIAMGYGATVSKKALISINNESITTAIDAIESITQQQKKKKNKKTRKEWSCPTCTFQNKSNNQECEMCGQIPEIVEEEAQKLKEQQEAQKQRKQEEQQQKNKKMLQQQEKLKKKMEEQQIKEKEQREKQAQILYSEIIFVKLVYNAKTPIDPFFIYVLLWNQSRKKTILSILRVGLNRKHLIKFYEVEGEGVIVSKLDRRILKKENLHQEISKTIGKFRSKVQWGIKMFEKPCKEDWILLQVHQIQFQEELKGIKIAEMRFRPVNEAGNTVGQYQIKVADTLQKSVFEVTKLPTKQQSLQSQQKNEQNTKNKQIRQVNATKQVLISEHLDQVQSNMQQIITVQSEQQVKVSSTTDCIQVEIIEHLPPKVWVNRNTVHKKIPADSIIQGEVVMSEYIPLAIQHYQGSVFSGKHYSTSILELKNVYISNYPEINFTFRSLSGKPMLVYSATVISMNKKMQKIYPIFCGLIFTANQLSWFQIAKKKFGNFKKNDYETWLQSKNSKIQRRQFWEPVSFFEVQGQTEVAIDYKRSAKYVFLLPTGVSSNPQNKQVSAVKMDFFGVKGRLEQKALAQPLLHNYKSEGQTPCELQLVQDMTNQPIDARDLIIHRASGINSFNYLLTDMSFTNTLPLSVTTFFYIRLRSGQTQKKLKIKSKFMVTAKVSLSMDNNGNITQQQVTSFKELVRQHHNITNFRIQQILKQLPMQNFILLLLNQQHNFTQIEELLNKMLEFAGYRQKIFIAANQILPNLCDENIKVTESGLRSFLRLYQRIYCLDEKRTFYCLTQCFERVTNYVNQHRNKSYNILRSKYGIQQLVLQPYLFSKDYYRLIHPNYVEEVKPSLVVQPKTNLNNKMYIQSHSAFNYTAYIDLLSVKRVNQIDLYFPQITENSVRPKLMLRISQVDDNGQHQLYYRYFHEQFLVQMGTYAYKENEIYSHSKVNCYSINGLDCTGRYLKMQVNFLLLTTLANHRYREPSTPIIVMPLVLYEPSDKDVCGAGLLQKYLLNDFPEQVKHNSIVERMPPCRFAQQNNNRLYQIHDFPVFSHEVVKNQFTELIDRVLINIMDRTIVEQTIQNLKVSQYEYNRKGIDFAYGLIIQISKFIKNMPLQLHIYVSLMLKLFDTFVVYELGPIMNKVLTLLIDMYKRINNQLKGQFIQAIADTYLSDNTKIKELKLSEKYSISKIIQKLLMFDLPIGTLFHRMAVSQSTLLKSILMRLIYSNINTNGINNIEVYDQNGKFMKSVTLQEMIQISFSNCLWIIDEVSSIREQMLSQSLDIFLALFEKEGIEFLENHRQQASKLFMKGLDEKKVWKLLFLTLRMKNNKLKSKIHKVFSILIENITEKFLKNINAMLLQIIRHEQQSIYLQLNKDISNEMWMNNLQTILEYLSLTKKKIFLDADTALSLLELPLTPTLWSLALQIIPREDKILMAIIKNFKMEYYNSLRKEITIFCQPLACIRSLESIHINWLQLVKQIRMDGKCIFQLFIQQLMVTSFGGREGLTMASLQDVKNLQITGQFLKLVLQNPLQQKNITVSNIHNIILWYFLNRTTTKGVAPATDQIKTISEGMLTLFCKITHFPHVIPICIQEVLNIRKETDIIERMFEDKQIPSHSALCLADRFARCTQQLLNIFMITDQLCNYFAFQISGLKYIMDHMGLEVTKCHQVVQMGPEEELILQEGIITTSKNPEAPAAETEIKELEDLKEEEFANNVKLVKQMNPENLTTSNSDWTIYKKGNKSKIIFLHMLGDHYYEYPLYITLGKTAELRSIKIGFPAASYEFNDKLVMCPSSVILEGSTDLLNFQPIGEMNFLPDDGYLCNGVKVFVLNLQKIRKLTNITSAVKQLQCHKIKHLKITVKRPLITFIEGPYSQLNSKNYSNLGCSICFISVNGDDCDKLPLKLVESCRQISARSTLNLLNLLMSESNPTTMSNIANADFFADKFYQKFSIIRGNMKKYTETMPSIVYALGNHNQKLGDWIIQQFLESGDEQMQAKIINQIITCTSNKVYDRINFFLKCLLIRIHKMNQEDQIQSNLLYTKSVHLIESFCKTLEQCYDIGFQQGNTLCCKNEDILNIISIYDKKYSSPQIKSVIRILITLLYLKKPLQLQQSVRNNSMNFIWDNCSQAKPYFYTLMASLLVNRESVEWLKRNQHQKVQQILQQIYKSIDKSNVKILKLQIFLLSQISFHEYSYLRQKNNHLKLYNLLKHIQYTDYDIFESFLKVMSNVVLDRPQHEHELAQLLIEDVPLLVRRKDPILQKFYVSLLGLQREVMINIKGLDISDGKKQTYIPTKLMNRKQQKSLIQRLNKKCKYNLILQAEQLRMQHMQHFTGAFNNNSGMLILVRFKVNNKMCVGGVYNNYKSVHNEQDSYFWQETINYDKKNFMFVMGDEEPIYIKNQPGVQLGILQGSEQDQNMLCFFDNHVETIKVIFDHSTVNVNFSNYYKDILGQGYQPNSKAEYCCIQLWEVKVQHQVNPNDNKISNFLSQSNQAKIPFNYYRYSPIYTFPGRITVAKFMEILGTNGDCRNKGNKLDRSLNLAELVQDSVDFIVDIQLSNQQNNEKQDNQFGYIPIMRIFDQFSNIGGVSEVLKLGSESIKEWKKPQRKKCFEHYMQQLRNFINLPNFFSLFIKNHQSVTFLFEVASGMPDDPNSTRNWEEEQTVSFRFMYKIVADIFKFDKSSSLRDMDKYEDFCEIILQKLAQISKETVRVQKEEETEQITQEVLPIVVNKKSEQIKQRRKKKGTGYGTDNRNNSKWSASEWIENRKMVSQQILRVVSIYASFLDGEVPLEDPRISDIIKESCLLPLIQSALRSGSLLDISKEPELFKCYLTIIKFLAHNPATVECLLTIPPQYKPQQTQSIHILLSKLNGIAEIFTQCSKGGTAKPQTNQTTEGLSLEIQKTYKIVDRAVKYLKRNTETLSISQINSLSVEKAYRFLLGSLRFGYINLKETSGYKHAHQSQISSNSPSTTKILRLSQELADLSSSLPCESTNSIFVRCDKSRIDVIKVLVMGSKDTPYSNGAFMFDVYCDDTYPNNPPKMVITTTGEGKIRFNPNLYSCGKVCLSLLGTWRGLASENWDPKLSTLLQLFISTQGITMSEDVYFNEPGFEGEQGTEEGEKKNQAYSNIVRLGNVRYAMNQQLKNPPKGFEEVIYRHFYVKKKQILEECNKWVDYADKKEASYNGLVNDHNSSWCAQLKASKGKYKQLLQKQISELQERLRNLPQPNLKQKEEQANLHKQKTHKKALKSKEAKLTEIDVGYDVGSDKQISCEEDVMQDRWSRYIGAMGIEAVKKQSQSKVMLIGCKTLGLQIAKNLVLSSLKKLTIVENENVNGYDQHFYMSDMKGKTIKDCIFKIKELNPYMTVQTCEDIPDIKNYSLVISTLDIWGSMKISQQCRNANVKFIHAQNCGTVGCYFADLGPQFEIVDPNGQEPFEGFIKNITSEPNGVVTLLDGVKHPYEDGDYIVLTKVEGMQQIAEQMEQKSQAQQLYEQMTKDNPNGINGRVFKIQVINWNSFRIGNTSNFSPYIRNGICKNIKIPTKVQFRPFKECNEDFEAFQDPNMSIYDFEKLGDNFIIYTCIKAYSAFLRDHQRVPQNWNAKDAEQFLQIVQLLLESKKKGQEELNKYLSFANKFAYTCEADLPILGALLGGIVAQQAIKAITNKYSPIKQFFTFHLNEMMQSIPQNVSNQWLKTKHIGKQQPFRNLKIVLGKDNAQKIQQMNTFVVGAGAIGCELLKNFAMINMGASGSIVVTDPDHIQTSNLTRQFLFRQKHVKKPKSATAAATLLQMNPNLNGHISARLDKVCENTQEIYSDKFFHGITLVANALDNVKARQYVDKRCVQNKKPLLESGTLGPKGHVQVIVPFKTQNYGSQNDPNEEVQIPHCTLKMFPEDINHCIQWSRDIFSKVFTLDPKALKKVIDCKDLSALEGEQKDTVVKMIKNRPINFDSCVDKAVNKFYKYFRNNVKQLLHTYPLTMKTKEGKLFWEFPKRPPKQISDIDAQDEVTRTFISSYAVLLAKTYQIPFPKNFRKPQGKNTIMKMAQGIKVKEFVPSQDKSKKLQKMNEKEQEKKIGNVQTGTEQQIIEVQNKQQIKEVQNTATLLINTEQKKIQLNKELQQLKINPEQFEKDEDSNGHVDLIYAMSNLRARNYGIDECKWIEAKLKAGRIMAALSTTTSVIAALQTIQLMKLVIGCETYRNAFTNLAVPLLQITEPGPAAKHKIGNTQFSVWQNWEFKASTLSDLLEQMLHKYQVQGFNLSKSDGQPVYWQTMFKDKEKSQETLLNKPLQQLFGEKNVELNVLMRDPKSKEIYEAVPIVRVHCI